MTETAVKEFQKHNGLKVDGIVGESTWAAIKKELEVQSTIEYYTVCIPNLTKAQKDELLKTYNGSYIIS